MSEPDRIDAAEVSLRAALIPILWVVSPVFLLVGLMWTQIDRPLAPQIAVLSAGEAVLIAALAAFWRRRPPQSVYFASVSVIATLHLCATAALLAYPEPVFGMLHLLIGVGTAVFLMDLRWMLGVQTFGLVTWIIPVYLAPPSPEWMLVGFSAPAAGPRWDLT